MKGVEMGSSIYRPFWFNTKYIIVGIIFGSFVTFGILITIPEQFGLKSLEDVEVMQNQHKSVVREKSACEEKLKQENSNVLTYQNKENDLQGKIKSCESAKNTLQQEHDKIKATLETLQKQNSELESQKSDLNNKDAENQRVIGVLKDDIAKLKTSLGAEEQKSMNLATQLETLKATGAKKSEDKTSHDTKPQ